MAQVFSPLMLVLHKEHASQLAPPNTPAAAVITTDDSTGRQPITKTNKPPFQISVDGDNTGGLRGFNKCCKANH